MTLFKGMGWLVAVVAAIGVALWSRTIGEQYRNPAASLAFGLPAYSAAGATLAYSTFAQRLQKDPRAQLSRQELLLAEDAYRNDPLSVTAVGLLALGRHSKDLSEQEAIFEQAGLLSRRSNLVSQYLIKAAAKRQDDAKFFRWLTRAAVTDTRARAVYIGAMVDATSRDDAVRTLIPVLGPDPDWAPYYWRTILDKPASIANAGRIRMAIMGAPWKQFRIKQTDSKLVRRLVENEEFNLARELAVRLGQPGLTREVGRLPLVNANFARQPLLPPFDWQLAASGNLGSSIDTANRTLTISALGGANGVAARQLVRLSPGKYVARWAMSANTEAAASPLTIDINCAERADLGPKPSPSEMKSGRQIAEMVIGQSSCRWYWFSLLIAVPDDVGGIDYTLHNLVLERVP
ncbi:hypothetical protein [Sphingopyxis macrogoltabida]|uniref:Uncharacterized protein n=1 Tax=Sphingopyxis macrogoltabida TaxID=33050 RepID=A0AAC9AXZ1_SPHMC|nr:hypothetical protein [Sphingopyxis macrogoltabida]ALJ15652.1 hypothetical protein LH19_22490 [Sphingopyxis macrogoltabida]AMU91893.1 hypothetical protein ATM17_23050 [Sphingopyxis macrogoltabida]